MSISLPLHVPAYNDTCCLVVDQALEVVEEYQGTILKLERDVLVRPNMKTVTARELLYTPLPDYLSNAPQCICSRVT